LHKHIIYAGIGKTTLANEICLRWARDNFLADDFDVVILVPLRTVQQRSLEETVIDHIGPAYQHLREQLGRRCLLILDGLDEMAAERQQKDPMLLSVIRKETLLEVTLLITSRPHACQKLVANRTIEIVGFGEDKIKEYVKGAIVNDDPAVDKFLQLLREYPHVSAMCYVPLSLNMILEIFQDNDKNLPLTLTHLYRLFIVMSLQIEQCKIGEPTGSSKAVSDIDVEKILHFLPNVPEEALETLLLLSKLAYSAFFNWGNVRETINGRYVWQYMDPKIIFTKDDLLQSGITLPKDSDGFGLLKCSNIKHLTSYSKTYSFLHLTVQEFLCALHIAVTLPQKEQNYIILENFSKCSSIIMLLCGLTELKSPDAFQLVYTKLSTGKKCSKYDVLNAVKFLYESQADISPQIISSITVDLSKMYLSPYDVVCVSHVFCHYPINALLLEGCDIGDQGVFRLAKACEGKNTQLLELNINRNHLTSDAIVHVIQILKSKCNGYSN